MEITDSPTTYVCSSRQFCRLQDNVADATPGSLGVFPGAGAALAIYAFESDPQFRAQWITFSKNVHQAFAPAFYVYKGTPTAATISLRNIQVQDNAAPTCSGALVIRQDVSATSTGGGSTCAPAADLFYGKAVTLDMRTPSAPSNPSFRWTGEARRPALTGGRHGVGGGVPWACVCADPATVVLFLWQLWMFKTTALSCRHRFRSLPYALPTAGNVADSTVLCGLLPAAVVNPCDATLAPIPVPAGGPPATSIRTSVLVQSVGVITPPAALQGAFSVEYAYFQS